MDESKNPQSDERPDWSGLHSGRPASYQIDPADQDRGVRGRGGPGAGRGLRPHQAGRPVPGRGRLVGHPRAGQIGQRVRRGRRRHRPGQREQHLRRDRTWPGTCHLGREGRRHRPGAHRVGQGTDHLPAVRRSRPPQCEVRAVRPDVQGHGPRYGRLGGPGPAPDAGRPRPGLLHRDGRELRYPRGQHVRVQAALLPHPRRGLRHRRRHHRHERRGDHRHRPADRPEPDRHGGRQDPDRAHAIAPAVRVGRRDRRPAGEPDRPGHRHHRGRRRKRAEDQWLRDAHQPGPRDRQADRRSSRTKARHTS